MITSARGSGDGAIHRMAGVPRTGGADTNAKSSFSNQTGPRKPVASKKLAKSDAKSGQKLFDDAI
jgi:hypothetical protein